MPDDSFTFTFVKRLLYSLSGENLGIAHDMLLQAVGLIDIADSVFEEEAEAVEGEQAVDNPLCRGIEIVTVLQIGIAGNVSLDIVIHENHLLGLI